MKNKILLITGHRKSGTTLLLSLFELSNNFLVYPADLSLMYKYYPIKKNNISFSKKKKLIKKIITDSFKVRFKQINYTKNIVPFTNEVLKKISKKNINDTFKIIKIIINEYSKFKKNRSTYFVIKETSQLINYDLFFKNFTNIKIINITREPLSNFSSLKSGLDYYSNNGEKYPILFTSFIFRNFIDLKLSKLLSMQYKKKIISIKYEDLVSKPKNILRKINNFLNSKIKFNEFKPFFLGQKFQGNSFVIKKYKNISKKRIKNNKKNLTKEETSMINFFLPNIIKNKSKHKTRINYFRNIYHNINFNLFYKSAKKII